MSKSRPHEPSRRSRCFLLTLIPLAYLSVLSLQAQTPASVAPSVKLEPGAKLVRSIKVGEKQYFEVELSENTAASVRAEQNGADVVLKLLGAESDAILEANLDRRNDGIEKLEFFSKEARTFKIEARSINDLKEPYSYEISLVNVAPATDQDRLLFDARLKAASAWKLLASGKPKDALPAYEAAVAALEKAQGQDGYDVGLAHNWLGVNQIMLGDLDKSLASTRRALSIFEKNFPSGHISVAEALLNLGRLEMFQSNFAESEALYLRAHALSEKFYGGDHPEHGSLISNLGVLYSRRAEFDRSEKMYEQALEIIARRVAKDDLQLAGPLKNIAYVRFSMGDYAGAAEYDLRAVEICKKKCPQNRQLSYMFALADDYVAWGKGQEAETLLNEILAGYEKLGDPSDQDWANSLVTLGRLHLDRGELEKARPLFAKAIAMAEKQGGYGTSPLTRALLSSGKLHLRAGELDNAEKSLLRGLELAKTVFVPNDQRLLAFLNSLSLLNILKGKTADAIALQERTNQNIEKNLVLNLSTGTEQQRLLYLQLSAAAFDQTIAMDVDRTGGPRARELAVSAVLQRKGRVLDALADTAAQLSSRSNGEDRQLIGRLRDTNTRLARLILDGRSGPDDKAYAAEVDKLQKEKDSLEIDLSRRTAGFFQPTGPTNVDQIRALIPPDAALVEFVTYRPIDAKNLENPPTRIAAYVIRQNGIPAAVSLGVAEEIESLIANYRSAARDPNRGDLRIQSKKVYTKIFFPIRKLLGDARHLIISPEGEMNLMPFESLIGESNRFLIQDYELSYLTSGRDLIRFTQTRESRSAPVVFANPEFGRAEKLQAVTPTTRPAATRRSVTVTRNLSGTYFAPLRGTAAEADAIVRLFPGTLSLSSADATEDALKSVSAPKILHVATHGFFVGNNDGAVANKRVSGSNPLFLSGLAFSGANNRSGAGEDGILTALEASGLDLWGTKLVVLSACDTGVGEVKTGEGVFGLRRAFSLAGAESMVMSLWPVSDLVTRELMVSYYKNLKLGLGRGESLRRAKLDMLRRPGRNHPFYWASFIQSGEWANLEGKR